MLPRSHPLQTPCLGMVAYLQEQNALFFISRAINVVDVYIFTHLKCFECSRLTIDYKRPTATHFKMAATEIEKFELFQRNKQKGNVVSCWVSFHMFSGRLIKKIKVKIQSEKSLTEGALYLEFIGYRVCRYTCTARNICDSFSGICSGPVHTPFDRNI